MEFSEKSIVGIFQNRAEIYKYETLLRYKANGAFQDLSWFEVQKRVIRLGCGLISLGVQPGDMVAIFSENRWEWLVADLAVMSVGASDAPIYATNSGEEAAYIINDSKAGIVFVSDQDHLDKILSVRPKLSGVKKIITFEDLSSDDADVLSLEMVMALGDSVDKKAFAERAGAIDPSGLATLIYTSGTTGPPKGVMLTHESIQANILQAFATHPELSHADDSLNILPWSHSLGRTIALYVMIHAGGVVSIAESFAHVVENLQEIRPTVLICVPRLYEKMYAGIFSKVEKAPPLKKKMFFWAAGVADKAVDYLVQGKDMPAFLMLQYRAADSLIFSKLRAALGLDRLKFSITGGAALALQIDRFLNGMGVTLHSAYGITEASPGVTVNTFNKFSFGTVGQPFPDTRIRIEKDGEIFIKGPQIMKGYYNLPDATSESITDDGWFKTGDVGYVDDEGFLRLTDRKKDIIITAGGKNISPQNIENSLVSDQYIEQAVVIGDGRKYLSALIVPAFGDLMEYASQQGISVKDNEELISRPEIMAFYDKKIQYLMKDYAAVEQLRRFSLLPRELSIDEEELTPTLKIKRKVINENHAAVIAAMYPGD